MAAGVPFGFHRAKKKEKRYDHGIRCNRDRYGQAGPLLAARLSKAMTVAVIERKRFGNTCVNTGCIPTKTLVARRPRFTRRVARYGVDVRGAIQVDMRWVKARKNGIAGSSMRSLESWLRTPRQRGKDFTAYHA